MLVDELRGFVLVKSADLIMKHGIDKSTACGWAAIILHNEAPETFEKPEGDLETVQKRFVEIYDKHKGD